MPKYPGISPYDNEKGTLGTAKKRWEKLYVKEIESDTIDGMHAEIDNLATTAENSVANAVAAKNAAVDAKAAAETAAETAATAAAGIQSVVETDVDNTLSIAGVAADAKVTGDWLRDIAKPVTLDTSMPATAYADEYMKVTVDSDNRVLYGVKRDGTFTWQKGVPKHVIEACNPTLASDEYLYVIMDTDTRILFGIKVDGTVDWGKGTPKHVIEECHPKIDCGEYVYAITDKDNRLLFGIKEDGTTFFSKWDKVGLDVAENEANEFIYTLQDKAGKILEGIHSDGTRNLFSKVSFHGAVKLSDESCSSLIESLRTYGFSGGAGDWSDSKELQISMPKCAVINFSGIDNMPQAKFVDMHGVMSFWDMQGNYFRKKVIMNAQGQFTMNYPKKNIAIDICNDDWIGDDTFSLRIGDWVAQDSFHIKAFWTDMFRGGIAVGGYKFADDIWKSRGFDKDRPWKKALIDIENMSVSDKSSFDDTSLQVDTGARNMPDGFPCIVYLNGEFYGVFAFQLKKHRDNMHQSKKNAKHIHLDSVISDANLLNGSTIIWENFEVRNPKSLYCMDGTKYDGDTNCHELIDSTSPYYNSSNDDHVRTASVKQYIKNLATNFSTIRTADETYKVNRTDANKAAVKAAYEVVFDVEDMTDYLIFCDVTRNWDGVSNNVQWCTYNGVKWYLCPYDLDHTFESEPGTYSHINTSHRYPFYYIYTYYKEQMEARYAELRRLGIVSTEHIVGIINDWSLSVGLSNFEKEHEKWSSEPQDSLFRVKKWVEAMIAHLDGVYHYNG